MSLNELLRHVKALPAGQRDRLLERILALQAPTVTRASSQGTATRVTWPDVEARAKRVVSNRLVPNLVLLERGEEAS